MSNLDSSKLMAPSKVESLENISLNALPADTATDSSVAELQTTLVSEVDTLTVKAFLPPKDNLDVFGQWAAIIGGLAAIIGVFIAFYQLFKKDEERQRQIDMLASQASELKKANDFNEKRLKLSVKPKIWLNGGQSNPTRRMLSIDVNNKGERAYFTTVEVLQGDVCLYQDFHGYELEKGAHFNLMFAPTSGEVLQHEITYKVRVIYHDEVFTEYELLIEAIGPATKIVSDTELVKA